MPALPTLPLSTALEPGDRFELPTLAPDARFPLPDFFRSGNLAQVIGLSGQALAVQTGPAGPYLVLPEIQTLSADAALWLEYQSGGAFRLVADRAPAEPGAHVTDQGVRIEAAVEDRDLLRGALANEASFDSFDLARRAALLATHSGFDQLICLPLVRDMELLEHQVRTAKVVLSRFRGKALLCDEVGLGKTIEAGIIFSELRMRGLIRSALVLVPPSLIEQWQGEMRRKFSLDLISHDDPAFQERGASAWNDFDLIIASLHTAKREPHRSRILARSWDLVVVDEAHHLRNRNTQSW